MGDSEDEYDRKRRDKFRGERTESYQRGEGRRGGGGSDDRRRDEWLERDSWGSRNRARTDYREYRGGGGGRERYSPARTHDISPPMKRVRTEWDDRRGSSYVHDGAGGAYGGGYASSWAPDSYSSQHSYGNHGSGQREIQTMETQPPMMSFKAYLQTQDDNITDDEAIKKYNEYKLEFKRQQLNEFFVTHKEEECLFVSVRGSFSTKTKNRSCVFNISLALYMERYKWKKLNRKNAMKQITYEMITGNPNMNLKKKIRKCEKKAYVNKQWC